MFLAKTRKLNKTSVRKINRRVKRHLTLEIITEFGINAYVSEVHDLRDCDHTQSVSQLRKYNIFKVFLWSNSDRVCI